MLSGAARQNIIGIWCRTGAERAAFLQRSVAPCHVPACAMPARHSMFSAVPWANPSASAAVSARRAFGGALEQGRRMSYFSGSHFDSDHMRDAKNPHLPEASAQP